MRSRAREGPELVVFPELAVTGYPPRDLLYQESLVPRRRARRQGSRSRARGRSDRDPRHRRAGNPAPTGGRGSGERRVGPRAGQGRARSRAKTPPAGLLGLHGAAVVRAGRARTSRSRSGRAVRRPRLRGPLGRGLRATPGPRARAQGAGLARLLSASPYRQGIADERLPTRGGSAARSSTRTPWEPRTS